MLPIVPKIQLNERQSDFLASQIEHENWRTAQMCTPIGYTAKNSVAHEATQSHFIHLFGKKQLTERNCTIKLENWLKYYNSSNIQLHIKLQVGLKIGLTVNVNDLLQMLTGKKAIVYRLGWHF